MAAKNNRRLAATGSATATEKCNRYFRQILVRRGLCVDCHNCNRTKMEKRRLQLPPCKPREWHPADHGVYSYGHPPETPPYALLCGLRGISKKRKRPAGISTNRPFRYALPTASPILNPQSRARIRSSRRRNARASLPVT